MMMLVTATMTITTMMMMMMTTTMMIVVLRLITPRMKERLESVTHFLNLRLLYRSHKESQLSFKRNPG
jgi:hypothetical protein